MRKTLLSIISFVFFLHFAQTTQAAAIYLDDLTHTNNCNSVTPIEAYFWDKEWSDTLYNPDDPVPFSQTTYKLEAPCKVFFGDTFEIRITVTDPNCTSDSYTGTVADVWSLEDKLKSNPPVTTLVDSGSSWGNDINVYPSGTWQRSYMRPTPSADDHQIRFQATDLGKCWGAHSWTGFAEVGTVVDPLPPANTPPQADAGEDIVILSADQTSTVINGVASDTDGDPLVYTWYGGSVELQGARSVESDGSAPLYLATLAPLSTGAHLLTLEVTDNTDTVSDTMELSIDNTAPSVVAEGGGTYNLGDDIVIGATVSDFDGDTLSYTWRLGPDTITSGTANTEYGGAPIEIAPYVITGGLYLGTYVLELTVTDNVNTIVTDVVVNVVDTEAPTLAPTATPNMLWPPNNNMVEVLVQAFASDNSGEVFIDVSITTSGGTVDDYAVISIDQVAGTATLQLRADKSNIDYTISVVATDSSGNLSSSDVVVTVPSDKKDKR